MNNLWLLGNRNFEAYINGKFNFLKLDAKQQQVFVDQQSNHNQKRFDGFSSIYGVDGAIKVTVGKDGVQNIGKDDIKKIASGFKPDTVAAVEALFDDAFDSELASMLYVIIDSVARIPVVGLLHRGRVIDSDYWRWGSTTYNEIIAATTLAESDPRVTEIYYDHNSGGGHVDGVDVAGMAIANAKKPTTAIVHYWSQSGSYWLASQAQKIVAVTPTVTVGSIGVAYDYYDWSAYLKKEGIKEVHVTSENAPLKRPDSKQLENLLKESANEIEKIFFQRIQKGREKAGSNNSEMGFIVENYGRGWDLIATKALAVGMIDRVDGIDLEVMKNINLNGKGGDDMSENAMNAKDFKEKYPDVFKETFDSGCKFGVSGERERVVSHMSWIGKVAQETIVKNINEGVELTNEVMLAYSDENAARIEKTFRTADDEGHEGGGDAEPKESECAAAGGNKKKKDGSSPSVDNAALEEAAKKSGILR